MVPRMEVVRDLAAPARWSKAAVAIGNFDGVHLGHRELLRRAKAWASAHGGTSVAVTFDPHPLSILAPSRPPALLTTVARRLELFAEAGIEVAVVLPFSQALAAMEPEAFVEEVLRKRLAAAHVVVGYDFGYGKARAGNPASLTAHGARAGFGVEVVAPVEVDGAAASSSAIRQALRRGEVHTASRWLGRPFEIDGVVVHGHKRGRLLGFPTANVAPALPLVLGSGIYACRLRVTGDDEVLGQALPAVASLGTNPTFATDDARTLEVYVLDFAQDLYDRKVRVELVRKLRDEAKFDSVEALVAQIARDVEHARSALGA